MSSDMAFVDFDVTKGGTTIVLDCKISGVMGKNYYTDCDAKMHQLPSLSLRWIYP